MNKFEFEIISNTKNMQVSKKLSTSIEKYRKWKLCKVVCCKFPFKE